MYRGPRSWSSSCRSRPWTYGPSPRGLGSAAEERTAAGQVPALAELLQLLEELRAASTPGEEELRRLEAASGALRGAMANSPLSERLELLRAIANLGTLPGRPFPIAVYLLFFLDSYTEELETLRAGETIAERAEELRKILYCFHIAGMNTEKLRLLYLHIEEEFPRIEAAGALLPMPAAVRLCHTLLATGLSSAPAVTVLLRAALREPLVSIADDALELRLLKMIELLVRVDFLHTQEQLPRDVTEYLSVIRSIRYYDRDLRRDTALSYQLAFFLRKHGFPSKRRMVGPYALKVCDPEERINFEPVEERPFRAGMVEEPPLRKKRHLEAVGWRSIQVHSSTWHNLETYEAKAAHVRSLLKENELLTL